MFENYSGSQHTTVRWKSGGTVTQQSNPKSSKHGHGRSKNDFSTNNQDFTHCSKFSGKSKHLGTLQPLFSKRSMICSCFVWWCSITMHETKHVFSVAWLICNCKTLALTVSCVTSFRPRAWVSGWLVTWLCLAMWHHISPPWNPIKFLLISSSCSLLNRPFNRGPSWSIPSSPRKTELRTSGACSKTHTCRGIKVTGGHCTGWTSQHRKTPPHGTTCMPL